MVTIHNLGLPKANANHSQSPSLQALQESKPTMQTMQDQDGSDLSSDLSSVSDLFSVGCTGVADPMVTMMDLLGHQSEVKHFKAYDDAQWFSSEARYVVPEFTHNTRFKLDATALINEVTSAKSKGLNVKPVIIGPITYLWFGTAKGDVNKLDLLESLLPVYAELLQTLSDAGVEWVQLDEPILSQEIDEDWKHALLQAYFHLQRSPIKKLLACYFGKLGDNLGLLRELTVDGVHLDTIDAEDEALKVVDWLPNYKIISVAVVDAYQLDKTDVNDTLAWLKPIHDLIGDRLWLAPSCSLAHLPNYINNASLLEVATQKLGEVKLLANTLEHKEASVTDSLAA